MKRKILTAVLAVALSVTALPMVSVQALAYTEGATYSGSDCTDNESAAATIDYLMIRYAHNRAFDSAGTCWGYAVKLNDFLAEDNKTSYYNGLRFTKANFKKKCLGVKAGTHIRFSHGSTFNGGYGHSVVLLQVDENKVYWADNNYFAYNTICYYQGTMNDFYKCYGQYGYINMIAKPTQYRTYVTPRVAAKVLKPSGNVRLAWLKSSGAEGYQIYRSYSKNGDYKLIGEADGDTFRYTDDTVKEGKKAWYKVRAVRKNGNKMSSAVAVR